MGEEVGAEMSYRTFGHLVGCQDLNYWLDNLDLHYIYRYLFYDFCIHCDCYSYDMERQPLNELYH